MVQGNLKPSIRASLRFTDDTIPPLTGASAKFHLSKEGVRVVDKTATIIDIDNGIVTYEWASGDTNYIGVCQGEFEITYSDTKKQTFPARPNAFEIEFRDDGV